MSIKIRLCSASVFLALITPAQAQQVSFHITPLHPVDQLREAALHDQPPHETGDFLPTDLVELTKIDPDLKLDIRYATTNNFLGVPLYTQARAFLHFGTLDDLAAGAPLTVKAELS